MNYIDIAPWRLLIVLALVLVCSLWVSRAAKLDLGRELVVGILRGGAQLLAVGYVLLTLFQTKHPAWVLLLLSTMLTAATWTSARRIEHGPPLRVLLPSVMLAITVGSLMALLPVFLFVVQPDPWWSPRYVVPITGMIVANAMNVVAQVLERLFTSVCNDRAEIEQWLALGATPGAGTGAPGS
jgi:putative ABC transport system permease protein